MLYICACPLCEAMFHVRCLCTVQQVSNISIAPDHTHKRKRTKHHPPLPPQRSLQRAHHGANLALPLRPRRPLVLEPNPRRLLALLPHLLLPVHSTPLAVPRKPPRRRGVRPPPAPARGERSIELRHRLLIRNAVVAADHAGEAVVPHHAAAAWIEVAIGRQRLCDAASALDGRGEFDDGQDAQPAVDEVQQGDAEAVDDDAEEHEEVDDGAHGAQQVLLLVRLGGGERGEEVARVLDVEDGADADGAEVAHEQRFLPGRDGAGHEFVRAQHGGDAAEEGHQQAQREQPADGDSCGVRGVEVAPGEDRADVHEAAEVEQHVDAAVDFVVARERLPQERAVPVQSSAGAEAGEEVV